MAELNLYTERKYSTVKLSDNKDYKIPNEFTVEEVERLLELRAEQEALENEDVSDQQSQLTKFWAVIFQQLECIFAHYQPEITQEYLKKVITHNEALEILGFFQRYRHIAIKTLLSESESANEAESKKKLKPANRELRELRRQLSFMVLNGFSLLELRKLYIDEMYMFYEELIFALENKGDVKDGSYAKMKKSDRASEAEDTVNLLRKQVMKSISNKIKQ